MKEIEERTNQYGTYKVWGIDRLLELQRMLDDGKSFSEIGRNFGISGTRVKQVAELKLGHNFSGAPRARSHTPRGNAVPPLQRPVSRPDAGASKPAPTLERGSQERS